MHHHLVIALYLAHNPFISNVMARLILFFLVFFFQYTSAQSAWPSSTWNAATSLTSVMSPSGVLELSGLHYNPELNRLYAVQGDGRVRVLQLSTTTNTFTQIANKSIAGGPEGITQADFSANEFYTIDENNYEIRKFTHTANFSTVTLSKQWNLLASPSPMQNTGNTGPEGIAFVPDANLAAIGFKSPLSGLPYLSQKGAGGLFFIAHQSGGYIWVFDVNPNVSNDFAYVGKIKTNRSESCDLAFDRSTGLLYVLHNVGANFIEVSDLATYINTTQNEPQLHMVNEYFVSNPTDGNKNIEGVAITPKCATSGVASLWLCRDVESDDPLAMQQDVLRWFMPIALDGECEPLSSNQFVEDNNAIVIYPNPGNSSISINVNNSSEFTATWTNILGQKVLRYASDGEKSFDVAALDNGVYVIEIRTSQSTSRIKWIKN